MFLRAQQPRALACFVLALVVTLAGAWPLLGNPVSRKVDAFQRYAQIMSTEKALGFALENVEFCCGPSPVDDQSQQDAYAASQIGEGKLILPPQPLLVGQIPATNLPLSMVNECMDGQWAFAPEPPPPRA
ncbi:MAG: hypothetical protein ACQKBV_04045 [Puniceicoccales bacterium]